MDKIMRLGSLLFTAVLLAYAILKYSSGQNRTAVYYLIAAIGFLVVYISYWKKKKRS
ncbi:MAG TPA: hypothetical protein VIK78_04510 [Ruminiclostridium sp.]